MTERDHPRILGERPKTKTVTLEVARLDAMYRLLIESGDMTPMAAHMLRQLYEAAE